VKQLLAARCSEVQSDASLVPADAFPDKPDAVFALAPPTERVAYTRLLDLDHVRAELGEHGSGQWTSGEGRAVDHTNAR
jgi:hypothetical protein